MAVIDFSDIMDSPLFKGLAAKEVELLIPLFTAHPVAEGKTIFIENMPGESLYIIKKGTIRISQMLSESNEQVLVVLGVGDIFGEMAVIDGEPRTTSARVAEDAILYGLKRKAFMSLVSERPRLAMQLTLNLAKTITAKMRVAKKDYRAMLSALNRQGG